MIPLTTYAAGYEFFHGRGGGLSSNDKAPGQSQDGNVCVLFDTILPRP